MGRKTWFVISISVLLACGTLLTGCDYLKATFDRRGYLEEKAKPLVTKYLRQENYGDVECLKVKITGNIDSDNYKAAATLDNGVELDIKIEDRDDTIWVQMDPGSQKNIKFVAREIVSLILRRNLGAEKAAKCTGVEITRQIDDKHYRGRANLDNGNSCDISIELRGEQLYVQILDL